ncbi:MAG: hypothetical protein P8Y28_00320 [Gammaproteobacteria bacterium]
MGNGLLGFPNDYSRLITLKGDAPVSALLITIIFEVFLYDIKKPG